MKILHIDDNNSITKVFSKILQLKNHEYSHTSNPKNGLEIIKKNDYDAIFLDIAMPEMSGYDVLEELKRVGKTPKNIIVLTATHLSDEEKERLNSLGVKKILSKPIKMQQILECLQSEDSVLVTS